MNLEEIKDILIDEDPEGLISMGCPLDEYDGEAQMIYTILHINENGIWNIHAIRFIVAAVLQDMFGDNRRLRWQADSETVGDIAERIYHAI